MLSDLLKWKLFSEILLMCSYIFWKVKRNVKKRIRVANPSLTTKLVKVVPNGFSFILQIVNLNNVKLNLSPSRETPLCLVMLEFHRPCWSYKGVSTFSWTLPNVRLCANKKDLDSPPLFLKKHQTCSAKYHLSRPRKIQYKTRTRYHKECLQIMMNMLNLREQRL